MRAQDFTNPCHNLNNITDFYYFDNVLELAEDSDYKRVKTSGKESGLKKSVSSRRSLVKGTPSFTQFSSRYF